MSALLLEPDPRSVRRARSWVVEELEALGRPELADAAELAVSELVTNALLHAEPPITVRLGGTPQHPRVEVHDTSTRAPAVHADMATEDKLLRTVGRGLGIVALYSASWGAELSPDGKVVWFEPAQEPGGAILGGLADELAELGVEPELPAQMHREPGGLDGDLFDLSEVVEELLAEGPQPERLVPVRLLDMPAQLFAEFRVWYAEIRRELRLLSFAHPADYPVADELTAITLRVEQERRLANGVDRLDAAIATGLARVDLSYDVPPSAAETMQRLADLLDQVDDFCREHRLLTMPATPEQVRLRRWYTGEFTRQIAGGAPVPWSPTGGIPATEERTAQS